MPYLSHLLDFVTLILLCEEQSMKSSIRKGWYLLTSGGRSVGIVRLHTKATEFKYCHLLLYCHLIISVLYYYYIILLLLSCITVILLILYYILIIILY
jgi:hypothetical protein